MSQYPDILANYETQLSTSVEEATLTVGGDQYSPQRQTPPNPLRQQTPSTQGNLAADKENALANKQTDPNLEMRRLTAANSKAIAAKARHAKGARRDAERTRQAEAEKTRLAGAAEKAENLARLGITVGTKCTPPNPVQKPTASPTPILLLAAGDPLSTSPQPSPTPYAPETLILTANIGKQHAPNTNTSQPPLDPETLPDTTATKPSNPASSPIDTKDLPDLENEEATCTNSQNPSIFGFKELRADDPEGEINSKRATGGGHPKTTA